MSPDDLEAVSRQVCEKRGVDPDARVLMPGDTGQFGPAWRIVAVEVARFADIAAVMTKLGVNP